MTNGGMKWNSFFVANACKTMQYNFRSNIKKIVKIIEKYLVYISTIFRVYCKKRNNKNE